MCIRDSLGVTCIHGTPQRARALYDDFVALLDREAATRLNACLLYTSDAADERSSVDLGGRRIIKKKKNRDDVVSWQSGKIETNTNRTTRNT